MTRHAIEIADARWEERARIAAGMAHIEAIEAAGEARAAQVAQQPREAIIRLAHDDRPPLLLRLVWPGVLLCALGLALMGVR